MRRPRERRDLDRERARWKAGLDPEPDGTELLAVLATVLLVGLVAALTYIAATSFVPASTVDVPAGTHAVSVRTALTEHGTSGEVMFG